MNWIPDEKSNFLPHTIWLRRILLFFIEEQQEVENENARVIKVSLKLITSVRDIAENNSAVEFDIAYVKSAG